MFMRVFIGFLIIIPAVVFAKTKARPGAASLEKLACKLSNAFLTAGLLALPFSMVAAFGVSFADTQVPFAQSFTNTLFFWGPFIVCWMLFKCLELVLQKRRL